MKPITLQEISELPINEQRQLKAYGNHCLGRLQAAQKRRKIISTEQRKFELKGEQNVP